MGSKPWLNHVWPVEWVLPAIDGAGKRHIIRVKHDFIFIFQGCNVEQLLGGITHIKGLGNFTAQAFHEIHRYRIGTDLVYWLLRPSTNYLSWFVLCQEIKTDWSNDWLVYQLRIMFTNPVWNWAAWCIKIDIMLHDVFKLTSVSTYCSL